MPSFLKSLCISQKARAGEAPMTKVAMIDPRPNQGTRMDCSREEVKMTLDRMSTARAEMNP